MKRIVAALLAGLLALAFGTASAASFDCVKASNRIESTICASPELSKLDEQLAATYAEVLSDHKAPDAIKASQRAWIKETRNACADERCIISAYQERIAAFQSDPGFRGAASMTAEDVANEDAGIAAAEAAMAASAASVSASAVGLQAPVDTTANTKPTQPQAASSSTASAPAETSEYGWRNVADNVVMVFTFVGLAVIVVAVFRKKIKKLHAIALAFGVLFVGANTSVLLVGRSPTRPTEVSKSDAEDVCKDKLRENYRAKTISFEYSSSFRGARRNEDGTVSVIFQANLKTAQAGDPGSLTQRMYEYANVDAADGWNIWRCEVKLAEGKAQVASLGIISSSEAEAFIARAKR